MEKLLKNKNALITGGGRGIGRAVAIEFAKNGANVAIAARTKVELEATLKALEPYNGKNIAIPCDLALLEGTIKCSQQYFEHFETCDILVNNAGMTQYASVIDYPLDKVQYMFNLNIMSYYAMVKHVLSKMILQKSGKIIMTSSVQGNIYFTSNKVAYATSKAAVSAMGRALHFELKSQGISVGTILPGAIETQMMQNLREMGQRSGDTVSPEEIAPIYLYLASDLPSRKYYGEPINQHYLFEILNEIKNNLVQESTEINILINSLKEKLKKVQYEIFRKNKELIEFLLSYQG